MSARKSFDIGPERPNTKEPARKAPVRRRKRRARTTVEKPARRATLRERREEARNRTIGFVLFGASIVAGLVIYGFWRPEIRINEVHALGSTNEETFARIALEEMDGAYWHVFPRDSFFFYPERAIRTRILEAYPSIESVHVSRSGFTSIELEVTQRTSAFWWCGSPETPLFTNTCYDADKSGFVYAIADTSSASSTALQVRAFLDMASSTDGTPIRARVKGSGYVPDVLDFIQTIQSLGVAIDSVAIRGDEADLFAPGGTRITYVIGQEKKAEKDARAAFPELNFANGTVEYVDLRFAGKVYVKRTGALAKEE